MALETGLKSRIDTPGRAAGAVAERSITGTGISAGCVFGNVGSVSVGHVDVAVDVYSTTACPGNCTGMTGVTRCSCSLVNSMATGCRRSTCASESTDTGVAFTAQCHDTPGWGRYEAVCAVWAGMA